MKQKPTSRRRRSSKSLLRLPDRECGRTSDAHAPKRYPPDYSRMTSNPEVIQLMAGKRASR